MQTLEPTGQGRVPTPPGPSGSHLATAPHAFIYKTELGTARWAVLWIKGSNIVHQVPGMQEVIHYGGYQ